jgi:hypothetical protein
LRNVWATIKTARGEGSFFDGQKHMSGFSQVDIHIEKTGKEGRSMLRPYKREKSGAMS